MPSFACEKHRNRHQCFRELQLFLNTPVPQSCHDHYLLQIWNGPAMVLQLCKFAYCRCFYDIYSTRQLLHNRYLGYIQLSASTVRSITVDYNTKDLNAPVVPVEMLQEDICQTLSPVVTVTRLFRANICFLENKNLPCP